MNDRTLEFDAAPGLLSPQGRERREEILSSLQRTRRNRRAGRLVLRASVVLGAIGVAVVLGLHLSTPATVIAPGELPKVVEKAAPIIHLVGGGPSTVRILSNDGPRLIRVLSDDQLLSSLREAGHPDGIAIVGGKFMLASQIVAEDVQTN